MLSYALRRLAAAVPIVLIALTACFFILRLAPGGPFDGERALPPLILNNLRAYYHLDQPLIVQYFIYVTGVLRGDFGPSMTYNDFTVSELLAIGLPFSLMLGLLAFVVATTTGIIAGTLSALYQNKWPDFALIFVVMIGLIIPNFLMANLLQLLLGVYLNWLPVRGYVPGSWIHMVLPVAILALPQAARVARLMRGSMIEVLGTNFIRTARSKGIGDRLVLARHAIKPALMPVVSYLGPAMSFLLTGSLVVEQVFALPGIGKYFISAALARDYGIVLGTTILYMVVILIMNLLVDVIYSWLDPRVRYR
jgi:oligopeptide transport system permease protein